MTSSRKSTLGPALSSTNPFASNFERVTSFADPGFWFSAEIKFVIGPRAGSLKNENESLLTIPICSAVQYEPSDSLDSSDETFEGFTEQELNIVAEKLFSRHEKPEFFSTSPQISPASSFTSAGFHAPHSFSVAP